jgi:hypothetical protein
LPTGSYNAFNNYHISYPTEQWSHRHSLLYPNPSNTIKDRPLIISRLQYFEMIVESFVDKAQCLEEPAPSIFRKEVLFLYVPAD